MIQAILAIAFILLVAWLIYIIVMWVWALILDIGAWVEANIVFLLAIGVLIGYVWWRAHLRAKDAQEQEEQAQREIQQRQLAQKEARRIRQAQQAERKAARDAQRRAEQKAVSYTHLTLPTICSV